MHGLLDLVYPPACLACHARTATPDALLCPACADTLADADPDELRATLCADGALDGAFARWRYAPDGPLGPLLHALKYGQRPRYGRLLGRSLATLGLPPADALVPLPLHRARWLDRGYNQSEEIALGLVEALAADGETGLALRPALLRRAHATTSQTRQDRAGRATNVAHAFDAAPEAEGLRLLVVDDVVTTGATAHSAARALKDAGAAWVGLVAVGWTR